MRMETTPRIYEATSFWGRLRCRYDGTRESTALGSPEVGRAKARAHKTAVTTYPHMEFS